MLDSVQTSKKSHFALGVRTYCAIMVFDSAVQESWIKMYSFYPLSALINPSKKVKPIPCFTRFTQHRTSQPTVFECPGIMNAKCKPGNEATEPLSAFFCDERIRNDLMEMILPPPTVDAKKKKNSPCFLPRLLFGSRLMIVRYADEMQWANTHSSPVRSPYSLQQKPSDLSPSTPLWPRLKNTTVSETSRSLNSFTFSFPS